MGETRIYQSHLLLFLPNLNIKRQQQSQTQLPLPLMYSTEVGLVPALLLCYDADDFIHPCFNYSEECMLER